MMTGRSAFYFCLLTAFLGQGSALKCLVCSDEYPGNSTASCNEGTATLLECEETGPGLPVCLYFKGTLTIEASGVQAQITTRKCLLSDFQPGMPCLLEPFHEDFIAQGSASSTSTGFAVVDDGVICVCSDQDGCNDSEAEMPVSSSACRPGSLGLTGLPSLILSSLLMGRW